MRPLNFTKVLGRVVASSFSEHDCELMNSDEAGVIPEFLRTWSRVLPIPAKIFHDQETNLNT
jgi:hypothetical protein